MIAVIGATGIVGGMITRRLLEQGKEVCILVRHNSPSGQLPVRLATAEFPGFLGRVLDLPSV